MASAMTRNTIQRMVVMVDIRDLKHIHQPIDKELYLAAIRDCVCKLLEINNNNNNVGTGTVWAFKLLDSSMWPYRSRSSIEQAVGKWAGHVHFEPCAKTDNFLAALKSLATANFALTTPLQSRPDFVHGGRLHFIFRSMHELKNDYIWESLTASVEDRNTGYCHSVRRSSNLVILFSPFPSTTVGFKDFLRDEIPGPGLEDDPWEKFSVKMKSVKEEFKCRDIHFCWMDVPPVFPAQEIIEREINPEQVVEAFKTLEWGFGSLDTVLVASKSVPFSLIWPTIAYPSTGFASKQSRTCGDIILEVEGIDGKPIRGRVCKVQCIDVEKNGFKDFVGDSKCCMDAMTGLDLSTTVLKREDRRRSLLKSSNVKIHVAGIFHMQKCLDVISTAISECVMLRNLITDQSESHGVEAYDEMGDEILERLQQQNGEFIRGKPAWQLFLAFLSSHRCMALVSVCDHRTSSKILSFSALLDPFTVHTAFLYVLDSNVELTITRKNIHVEEVSNLQENNCVLQEIHETHSEERFRTEKQHKRKRPLTPTGQGCTVNSKRLKGSDNQLIKCNTWDSFYTAIVWGLCKGNPIDTTINSSTKLESRYIKGSQKQRSKVLRILGCWFNQSSKILEVDHDVRLKVQSEEEDKVGVLDPLSPKDSKPADEEGEEESSMYTSSEHENLSLSEEDAENFISSVDEKIQHALSDKGVDLGALAKRLVESLVQSFETQCRVMKEIDDAKNLSLSDQLMNVLLKKPKEMATKYKKCLPPLPASQPEEWAVDPLTHTSEDKVREHELQILLRMEILAATKSTMEEDEKETQLAEGICELLENIQFNLPGGVLEGQSLIDYSDKVIKSRYINTLPHVIETIYEHMDFDEPDQESSGVDDLVGSEEGNIQQLIMPNQKQQCQHNIQDDYETKLKKAQLKRERARRFSHFSSKAPDLKRVWTPKPFIQSSTGPPKTTKDNHEVNIKESENCVRGDIEMIANSPVKIKRDGNYIENFSEDDESDEDDMNSIPESPARIF